MLNRQNDVYIWTLSFDTNIDIDSGLRRYIDTDFGSDSQP